MRHALVLKQGLLSEKIYNQMESGVYTFMVSKEARKEDVKKAVEAQFSTKVKKVNIIAKPSKLTRVTGTRKMTETGTGKKAVVFLEKGQTIAMLSPKTESKKDKKDSAKTARELQPVKGEKESKRSLISRIRGKSAIAKEESGD